MILICGDALIDFVPVRLPDGRDAYHPVAGGSCLNVAVAIGRLGAQVGFVGGISTDAFGAMLAERLTSSRVDIARLTRSDHQTTLAFVRYVGTQAQYLFYDEATASRLWKFDPAQVGLGGVELVHVGSVPLIEPAPHAECRRLVEAARPGATVSIDPNCRPTLIRDPAGYRARIEELLRLADIVRVSTDDLAYLRPSAQADDAAADWLARGASLVIVTAGEAGATAYTKKVRVMRPAQPAQVVDTIGAGDTFHAALLVWLSEAGVLRRESLRALSEDQLGRALVFAGKAAAITCSRPGADPPWRREMDS